MVKLTQVQNPVLDTCLTLRKLAYSDYVKTRWERLVIGIHDKALAIRRPHTDKPRGSGCVIRFGFVDPVEEIREEFAEFLINDQVSVSGQKFESSTLHNTKAGLFHARESNGRYIDIGLKAIDGVKR
jgi:hypothetical protein